AKRFAPLAQALTDQEQTIVDELIGVQGSPVEIGGYYEPDPQLARTGVRPSRPVNAAPEHLQAGAVSVPAWCSGREMPYTAKAIAPTVSRTSVTRSRCCRAAKRG